MFNLHAICHANVFTRFFRINGHLIHLFLNSVNFDACMANFNFRFKERLQFFRRFIYHRGNVLLLSHLRNTTRSTWANNLSILQVLNCSLRTFRTFRYNQVVFTRMFSFNHTNGQFFRRLNITTNGSQFRPLSNFIRLFLNGDSTAWMRINVQARHPFKRYLRMISRTATDAIIIATRRRFFNNSVNRQVLFTCFRTSITTCKIRVTNVDVSVIRISVGELRVLRYSFDFFTAQVVTSRLLMNNRHLFQLIIIMM